jgi:CTP-dependent riboflavin kinase
MKHQDRFDAVAEFLDWLTDKGYLIAKSEHGEWCPITEREADALSNCFISDYFRREDVT